MIIATVHSLEDEEKVKQIKDTISNTFLTFGDLSGEYKFSVRSVFWQVHENASDPFVFEHIGGVPYVYETILGVRFQISPYTFFQTNSRGCELLYTAIGDFLGLPKENEKIEQVIVITFVNNNILTFRKQKLNKQNRSIYLIFVVEREL